MINEPLVLRGRLAEIEVVVGAVERPGHVPFVCASETGYSPLGPALGGARNVLTPLVDWMRSTTNGAYVALVDEPPARRPLAIIQSNRGPGGQANFYESHHTREDEVWRDFYYKTTFAALREINDRWAAEVVEVSHPTGFGWPQDLVTVVLEALGQISDQFGTAIKKVHLTCLHDLTFERVRSASDLLSREQSGPAAPRHRDFQTERIKMSAAGLQYVEGVSLVQVPVQRHD